MLKVTGAKCIGILMVNSIVLDMQRARDKVFYLLKKYTSHNYLSVIYKLEKEFVDAFEQQLRHPPHSVQQLTEQSLKNREKELLTFLGDLNYDEKGLKDLLHTKFKKEAYELFFQGDIQGQIFGRYSDENGLVDNVFYQNLGLGQYYAILDENHDHTKYILKLLIASDMTFCISNTLYTGEYVIPKEDRIYDKWSYESLFSKLNWPVCKQIVEPISPCPDYNDNSKDKIHSGEEIQITGIYEPWFDEPVYKKLTNDPEYNVYVGCPNYFLEGSEATQYKLEGTDDWYDVKWHLIWEDNRYLDGTLPEEELAYTFDLDSKAPVNISENNHEKLSIPAREKVPQAGYWYTTAKETSRQYFKQGDIFPDVESDWGDVYWYFDGEK